MRQWWSMGLGLAFACAFILIGSGGLTGLNAAPAGPGLRQAAPLPPKPGQPPADAQDGISVPHVQPLRTGGPDAYGYVYDDSTDAGGPVFNWIAATTVISDLTGEDDYTTTVALPFPLYFYNSSYTALMVSTNGNAHVFDNGDADYSNICLPNPAYTTLQGIIAPFWDDFNLGLNGGGDVYTSVVGSSPNRIFVLDWRDVVFYNNQNSTLTFEMLIYESNGGPNEIRFQYLSLNGAGANGSSATVGI